MTRPSFTPGQKVLTIYGQIRTVLSQKGCMVFLDGENVWFHHSWIEAAKANYERPWT